MHTPTRGGHSHRRRVRSCDRGQDAVKRSRHFLGVGHMVKRSSSVLGHYLRHYWRSRGVADPFAHVQLIDGQGSRAKIQRGQAVKAVFRWSKILTPVAALDTAPMGVTTPCTYEAYKDMHSSIDTIHPCTINLMLPSDIPVSQD